MLSSSKKGATADRRAHGRLNNQTRTGNDDAFLTSNYRSFFHHGFVVKARSSFTMIAHLQSRLAVLLVLVTLASTAWADQDFRGQIQPNAELGHLLNLGPNTRVLLHAIPPQSSSSIDTEALSSSELSANNGSNRQLDLAAFGQQRDRSTLVGMDGSFIFRNLEQGAYTLQVVSRTHTFERYRVDVLDPQLGKAPQIRIFTP